MENDGLGQHDQLRRKKKKKFRIIEADSFIVALKIRQVAVLKKTGEQNG